MLKKMKFLPVALNVQDKSCLVVGGGLVAERKAKGLLECGAHIIVIAPALCDGFASLLAHIEYAQRAFQIGDCRGCRLVFACTDDRAVNEAVAREAAELGLWCSVADDAATSGFHSAAAVRRGDICIGITTAGGSPALAKHLKAKVEACLGPEYSDLLEIMGARRAALPTALEEQGDRAQLWRAILESATLRLLEDGDRVAAESLVDELIQQRRENGT
jgi:precorrin-2 dehydrogenase / sirohydrochlorin ferrochelatase